jgi:hypothetical protein
MKFLPVCKTCFKKDMQDAIIKTTNNHCAQTVVLAEERLRTLASIELAFHKKGITE